VVAAGAVVFVWHRDNQNQRGESILPSLDRSSAPTPWRKRFRCRQKRAATTQFALDDGTALEAEGIDYVHLPGLGDPKEGI
jgi:hypothetical protein